MDKKGFVTMHAGLFFIIGLAIGAAVVYFLFVQGFLPLGGRIN